MGIRRRSSYRWFAKVGITMLPLRCEHARIIYDLLAHQFIQASRRDLRRASGLDSCQLFRALMRLEADGVLLAERKGRLSIADRLYSKTGTRKGGDTRHNNNTKHGYE